MPRISVTLQKHQYEVIEAISTAQGASMSSVMSDLVDMALPVLERTAATMLKLKQYNEERKQEIRKNLDEAQTTLEPIMEAVLGQYDMFLSKPEELAMGGAGAGSGSASDAPSQRRTKAADPRLVITGVNPPAKVAGKRASVRVSKART
jgi:hypothetical protein